MKTTLIFVRHGDLEGEHISILHKVDDRVELSTEGKIHMQKAAEALQAYHPDALYTSGAVRTEESAQIISKALGLPIQELENFHGREWGDLAGKSWSEVGTMLSDFDIEQRFTYIPPGGESWQQFEARLVNVINDLAQKNQGKTVAVVAHGSALRGLLPPLWNYSHQESTKLYPEYASLSIVEAEDGIFNPLVFNATDHLS